MNSRVSQRLLAISVSLLLGPIDARIQVSGQVAARPPQREVAVDYIQGIEALESADFKRAVSSLTRAIEDNEENSDYHRARGVANTLAENFPAAISDLQRALKLRPQDREARLWLGAAYRMSGDPMTGAQYFTHGGEVPVAYASLVYNDMAMEYWSSRYKGNYFDRQAGRSVTVREPIKRFFPDAARAYAHRHKAAGPAASDFVRARLKTSLERGDWAAALKDLTILRAAAPDDAKLRGDWALCLLGLGDAWHARVEFTRTLCVQPNWADGYLGRAQASAMLGNLPRARSDIETASSLGANVSGVKAKVAKLGTRIPDDAVERFSNHVEAEQELEALTDTALAVHRWGNARRLRYDEAYQDRIWILTDALRHDSKEPDLHEMLARFLYNHHVPPKVWNGPRGAGEQLRSQSPGERAAELQRGIELSDAALKLDKGHVNAIATKGWIFYTLHRSAEAEALANRGLEIGPKNVRLMRLKAQILVDSAAALQAQAAALRVGRTEISREQRSDGEYEVRKYYPPTSEQLAQAASLEAQASAYRKQAQQLSNAAEQVSSTIIPALFKDGDTALAAGDAKRARRKFEEAYSYDPDYPESFSKNLAIEPRLAKAQLVQVVPTAMLPDPGIDSGTIPEAPSLASLMAWSRLGKARALLGLGRPAEAEPEYQAVRAYLAHWPSTAKDRETMNIVDSWARLGLADAAYAAKDYETAFRLLMSGEGWPWNLPAELAAQKRALSEKVVSARKGKSQEAAEARRQLSPRERQIRNVQQQIESMQAERDRIQAALDSGKYSPGDRKLAENGAASLDKVIASKKEALKRLEETSEPSTRQAPVYRSRVRPPTRGMP